MNEALRKITAERKDVDVVIAREGDMVTMDICDSRVRLWTDNGTVSREPRVG